MEKDFDKWNGIKKYLELLDIKLFPKEREVWMSAVGRNVGFEQNGAGENFGRPVLVVKKFNNQMFWVVPLSTKQKNFDFYFNFSGPKGDGAAAILAQLRLMSVKRFERNLYTLSEDVFNEIRERLGDLLLNSKPRTRRGFSEPEGTL